MDTLSLEIPSLEEKDGQQMITLVDTSQLDDGNELVDNSAPLIHHVLEPSDFTRTTLPDPHKSHEGSSHCLICNVKFGVSGRGSIDLFTGDAKTSSRHLDLVFVLSAIVGKELDAANIHSPIICKKCFKLLDDIDSVEGQLLTMKQEVSNKFMQTQAIIELEKSGIVSVFKDDDFSPRDNCMTKDEKEFKITSRVRGSRRSRRGRGRGRPPPVVKLEVKEEDNEVFSFAFSDSPSNGQLEDDEDAPDGASEEDNLEVGRASIRRILGEDNVGEVVPVESDEVFEVDGLDFCNKDGTLQIGGLVLPTINHEVANREGFSSTQNGIHELPENKPGKYRCRFCQMRTHSFPDIQNHLIQFHADRLFECDVCEERLASQSDLLKHLEHHLLSGDKPFSCRLCSRRYSFPRQLKEHLRHHLSKTISCYHCPKRFRSEGAFQEHLNTHTGYRPYPCDQCHKRFTSKHILKTHMRTHGARNRPHKCQICHKHFLTAHHLNDHTQIHQNRRDFICENCGKAFSTQRSLDLHSITHSGVKNFICRICCKAFARKGEVEDHERIHTGEKPFQCEICGATFSQRSNLQSHKRATHFEEKKYSCADCSKAFKRRRLLVYHIMSVHTGERPYKCNFCSAAFVYPEHYKKHLRIHTGEKPFKCEVCGKAFNSKDNKNAHKFIHSEKKQYECVLCGVGFMRKPQLMAHIMQHDRTENLEAYIKVNSSSIVDAELVDSRAGSSPALGLKMDEDQSMEPNLEDHIQLVRAAPVDGEAVEVLPRPIQIVDSDDVPRYIIHRGGGEKSDDAVGHFLASLQGSVVEVRTDDLERYTELTADQLTQMAQVAAQVVATQSNGNSTSQLPPDSGDFRLFQIQLEEEKDGQPPTAILTSEEPTVAHSAQSKENITLVNRQNQGILKKVSPMSQSGPIRHLRTWPQTNEDFVGGS